MAWDIVYYKLDDGSVPGEEFLDHKDTPDEVDAEIQAVLEAVSEAPPPAFSGGGKWEATKGLSGVYEVRVQRGQWLYRLFCVLDNGSADKLASYGLAGPAIAVLDGRRKKKNTVLSKADYESIRQLGLDYKSTVPRSINED